jgi:hypothetical protein
MAEAGRAALEKLHSKFRVHLEQMRALRVGGAACRAQLHELQQGLLEAQMVRGHGHVVRAGTDPAATNRHCNSPATWSRKRSPSARAWRRSPSKPYKSSAWPKV